jgi:dephospho-CoA kinase
MQAKTMLPMLTCTQIIASINYFDSNRKNIAYFFEVEAIIGNKYDDYVRQIVVVYSINTLI